MKAPLRWVILLLVLQFAMSQKKGTFDSVCASDAECDPPMQVCAAGKCKNKELFPTISEDIIGSILIIIGSALGIMVGIGGGAVVGPIGYIYMNMSNAETNALSNGLALVIAIAKLINSLPLRHPENQKKVLIDYDAIYILGPFLLIGNLLSSLITPTLPELLVLINFVGLLLFSFYAGFKNYRVNRGKELRALENRNRNEEERKKGPGVTDIDSKKTDFRGEELELDQIPVEFGQEDDPGHKRHLKKGPALPSQLTAGVSQEDMGALEAELPPLTLAPRKSSMSSETRERIEKKVTTEEKRNCSPKKLMQVGLLFVFVNVVTVLRAGVKKSVVGIVKCSAWFWVLISFYVLGCLAFSYFGYAKWKRMHLRKAKLKITCPTDMKWPQNKLKSTIFLAILIEFLSSISGIGGTGITVFLMSLNINTKSASATSLYLVFLSRFILTFLNYLVGTLRLDYFLFNGGISFVLCLVFDRVNECLQKKFNRLSLMSIIFMVLVGTSALVYGIGGSIKLHGKTSNGTPLFQFDSFC